MNISFVTNAIINVIDGTDEISVVRDYDSTKISNSDGKFITVSLRKLTCPEGYSDVTGTAIYRQFKAVFRVSLYGKITDGKFLSETVEKLVEKIYSANVNITAVECLEMEYSSKLSALLSAIDVTVEGNFLGDGINSKRNEKLIPLSPELNFLVESYEFERSKIIAETPSVISSVNVTECGTKAFSMKLCGNIYSNKAEIVSLLDNLIFDKTKLNLKCLGINTPQMLLKKYLVKGEKGRNYCELTLSAANASEKVKKL
ncbi:MAG: hypothetical protein RR540_01235 [Oscillospiraceae bacterium]